MVSREEKIRHLEKQMDDLFVKRREAESRDRVKINANIASLNRAYHDLTMRYYADDKSVSR